MLHSLIMIARDWAIRSFGAEQMRDPKTRALRLVEEAIEFAQAVGVDAKDVHSVATDVYSREPGDPHQEMGGVYMTAHLATTTMRYRRADVYGDNLGWDPEDLFVTELRRVLEKEAQNPGTFAKRNEQKINLTPVKTL